MNSVITDELIKGSALTMIGIGVGFVVWAIIEEKRK